MPPRVSFEGAERPLVNPFEARAVTLTVLELRYILHALRLCKGQRDAAEETLMNEHCQSEIERATK